VAAAAELLSSLRAWLHHTTSWRRMRPVIWWVIAYKVDLHSGSHTSWEMGFPRPACARYWSEWYHCWTLRVPSTVL